MDQSKDEKADANSRDPKRRKEPTMAIVPNVISDPVPTASDKITSEGLTPKWEDANGNPWPDPPVTAKVTEQNPVGGTDVPSGTTVKAKLDAVP